MTTRRMGRPDAAVRQKLLDATEAVLARSGYPAVTSRNVGAEAGVTQKLIFYYFRNMEELIVATFHRRSETFLEQLTATVLADDPLSAIWHLSSERSGALIVEFMAMATHNPVLRAEIADYTARANAIQHEALARFIGDRALDPAIVTPGFLTFLVASLARNIIVEGELGLLSSPEELRRSIVRLLDHLSAGAS